MRIAQLSDIHVLDPRFEERLLDAAIEEINAEAPDLVVMAGDLTANGYREEFEYARDRLDGLDAREVLYVPGNHDARSVGLPALRGPVRRARPCQQDRSAGRRCAGGLRGLLQARSRRRRDRAGAVRMDPRLVLRAGGLADLRHAPPPRCDPRHGAGSQSGLGRGRRARGPARGECRHRARGPPPRASRLAGGRTVPGPLGHRIDAAGAWLRPPLVQPGHPDERSTRGRDARARWQA